MNWASKKKSNNVHLSIQIQAIQSIIDGPQIQGPHEGTGGPGRGYRDSLLETVQEAVAIAPKCAHNWAQYMWQQRHLFFESLHLVLGLRKIAPWVNCPYAPTTPTIHSTTISRFLCNFFPRMAPHFVCHHDSPSKLAESRYPPWVFQTKERKKRKYGSQKWLLFKTQSLHTSDIVMSLHLRQWQDRFRTQKIARWKLKPKSANSILQAVSCRFFGCNLLFCVFLTFMICLCFVQFKDCSRARGVTKPNKQTNKQTKTNEWCPNTHTFACGQAIVTLHSVWQTSHVCTYTWSATVRDSFLGPGHAATERAVFARPLERTRVIRKK